MRSNNVRACVCLLHAIFYTHMCSSPLYSVSPTTIAFERPFGGTMNRYNTFQLLLGEGAHLIRDSRRLQGTIRKEMFATGLMVICMIA
jgi:hypothetical protein